MPGGKKWLISIRNKLNYNGCLKKAKLPKVGKVASNLASFYGSHIDGIVCVKQIDSGSIRYCKN